MTALIVDCPDLVLETVNVVYLNYSELEVALVEYYDCPDQLREHLSQALREDFRAFTNSDFGKHVLSETMRFSSKAWSIDDIKIVYASARQLSISPFWYILTKYECAYSVSFQDIDTIAISR